LQISANGVALEVGDHVARMESTVLVNPRHPDLGKIAAGRPEPVIWDARLFGRSLAARNPQH